MLEYKLISANKEYILHMQLLREPKKWLLINKKTMEKLIEKKYGYNLYLFKSAFVHIYILCQPSRASATVSGVLPSPMSAARIGRSEWMSYFFNANVTFYICSRT